MSDTHCAYIALGSNLGDRLHNINTAIEQLRAHKLVVVQNVSSVIETEPIGVPGQERYLNAAIALHTTLTARELLHLLLEIEQSCGRERRAEQRWGPRTLDLDLLLYDDAIIDEPGLTVPHPRMHERAFVLTPLVEIAPNAWHPVSREPIQSLLNRLGSVNSRE